MKFRFHQITPRGIWVSQGVFEAEYGEIVEQVMRANVTGQPRAVGPETGAAALSA